MNWLKTKKVDTEISAEADPLFSLVRTMEDDLSGREVPPKPLPKAEPLVGFDPNAPTGAAFYAAPGVETAETVANVPEKSPFLSSPEVPTPPQPLQERAQAPVAAPPAALPVLPTEPLALEKRPEEENKPIALTVTPAKKGASFEGVLPTRGQTLSRIRRLLTSEKAKWVFLAVGGIAILLFGAGLYFWKMKKETPALSDEMTNKTLTPAPEKASPPEPVSQQKYQADQPNILSFDTETVTPLQIKNALLQAGQEIKKDGLPGAVEFLVRDQKLNPLALSRFAYLAKIELPGELLEILDEPFSLYIFIDNDRPRAVLLAYAKNQEALSLEVQKTEKALPLALDPLFLDMTTATKTNLTFRDGSYLERPVRFANVDDSLGLSVDYAVRGKQWIIGTSKGSLRAVLDKTGL